MTREYRFYLVREDVLPDAIVRTARVKELLAQGRYDNAAEAVKAAGLARSTFYKYRDGVHPFLDAGSMKIINLSLPLHHEPGVLSRVLNHVASRGGNILTINQSLPLQGTANVTMSIDIEGLQVSTDELLRGLAGIEGVIRAELIGKS